MALALGGLAVLLGAVYGIKRKVDSKSIHISLNKDMIKRKFISPIIDSRPHRILLKKDWQKEKSLLKNMTN